MTSPSHGSLLLSSLTHINTKETKDCRRYGREMLVDLNAQQAASPANHHQIFTLSHARIQRDFRHCERRIGRGESLAPEDCCACCSVEGKVPIAPESGEWARVCASVREGFLEDIPPYGSEDRFQEDVAPRTTSFLTGMLTVEGLEGFEEIPFCLQEVRLLWKTSSDERMLGQISVKLFTKDAAQGEVNEDVFNDWRRPETSLTRQETSLTRPETSLTTRDETSLTTEGSISTLFSTTANQPFPRSETGAFLEKSAVALGGGSILLGVSLSMPNGERTRGSVSSDKEERGPAFPPRKRFRGEGARGGSQGSTSTSAVSIHQLIDLGGSDTMDDLKGDVLDQGSSSIVGGGGGGLTAKQKASFARGDGVGVHDREEVSNGSSNGHSTTAVRHKKVEARVYSPFDQEVIRLAAQHLQSLGLSKTVETLIAESGCQMEQQSAAKFRENVMRGSWDEAEKSLKELATHTNVPNELKKMQFLLREQRYLEYLQDGKTLEALTVLRQELTPLDYGSSRVHQLSRCLMISGKKELCQMAKWTGKGAESRQLLIDKMQAFLPPSVMLPPRRMRTLLDQAMESQIHRCPLHNVPSAALRDNVSLLVDHTCGNDFFPTENSQTLSDHTDEVWFCRFSPDGKKLATGSKDYSIIIWDVDLDTREIKMDKSLESHPYGVQYLAWSPDGKYLASCGPPDETADEVWIWDVEMGEVKSKFSGSDGDCLTTCAWDKDGKQLVTGGIRGQFYLCDLDGQRLSEFEGVRVQCLAFLGDGRVLAADTHHRIKSYDFSDLTDGSLIQETYPIMSFTCDRAGRYALINMASQGIHLWDIEDKVLVRKFQGLEQGYYTIHSCFGGVDEKFIASGSEDYKVHIWSINQEKPVFRLVGHTKTVNCVHWNPACPGMLASVSDDCTVKIWTTKDSPDELPSSRRSSCHPQWEPSSNGSSSNGYHC
ncbi:WD repeat-containing protein 26 [Hypsibius exemplaris]|uniref:WD repeat-containing protein 26 n=1 Tax=Hypsibius exemplaris TaxID=2072580 RepID=A0A1W0W9L1_HYPEX|nr:WD repeat-containing protein 26 [Hypsibius exemplaris]